MADNILISLDKVSAVDIFTGSELDDLLKKIRQAAVMASFDVSTEKGRKEIASQAYAVSRSKTTIDNAGKELVAEWKAKSKAVDESRKKARDYLDALRDEVRKPLTEWEDEQKRIEQEQIEAARKREEEAERKRLAEIEAREAEIRKREQAIRAAEEAKRRQEESARIEAERIAREERIAKEAAERAEREKIEAEARTKAAIEKAKLDAEEAARRAEEEKARAVAEAERKAKEEAQRIAAEQEAARRAEEQERLRIERDKAHRQSVHAVAIKSLAEAGIAAEVAQRVVELISADKIQCLSVNYHELNKAAA